MRLPRDVSGKQLIKALSSLGFSVARQSGSHVRLVHDQSGEAITIPMHDPIRIGTLARIVADVCEITSADRSSVLQAIEDAA